MPKPVYADTSVLVAYYVAEPLSQQVDQALAGHDAVSISDLVEAEFFSTLARKVREKSLSTRDADSVARLFREHLHAQYYVRHSMERRHFKLASRWLADRVGGLRTLDALHLAVVHDWSLEMWTADIVLHDAARELGIASRLFRTT